MLSLSSGVAKLSAGASDNAKGFVMGCEVYANGDEIACKAGDGKVIAAFPDVCLSPPSPPAGPIPVPYPDTSFSKDMQNGSKTVRIKGKEVMLKDQSFYKTSPLGDEAATRGLGAGVVTHVITGKTYFVAWSMDVKFEDQNVDRHTDITTSNHASPMGNSMTMANLSATAQARIMANKCPCCGNDPHCQAQKDDIEEMKKGNPSTSLDEEEFYDTKNNVENKLMLDEIRANPRCKNLLPDPGRKECNRYYKTSPAEKKKIEKKWDNHKRKYDIKGKQAHKVPKSAGGCPTRDNVTPIKGCKDVEDELEDLQKEQLVRLGWRAN